MSNFPTLSKNSNINSYSQTIAQNPTLVSDMENGYQIVRAKYKNVALKFEFNYSLITDADKILLEDFEKDRSFQAGSFNWISPSDITYEVRFIENLKFTKERNAEDFWSVAIKIREIRPSSSVDIS